MKQLFFRVSGITLIFLGVLLGGVNLASSASTTVFANNLDINIPDDTATGATRVRTILETEVPGSAVITKVVYGVEIDHTYPSDLLVTLTSPSGKTITIWDNEGGSTDAGEDDDSESDEDIYLARPTEEFDGELIKGGPWTFKAVDSAPSDVGTFRRVALAFNYELADVTSLSPLTGVKDQTQDYTVLGSNLPSSIAFTIADATGCGRVSYTSSMAVFSCTPQKTGSKKYLVKDRSGGNTIDTGYVSVSDPAPIISSVSPLTGELNVLTDYTVTGSNLPSSIAFTIAHANGCDQVSYASTRAVFRCTPRLAGVQQYIVKDRPDGSALKYGVITISSPTPQITSVFVRPSSPVINQPVTITAQTDTPANQVEFQFAGMSSKHQMASTNSGRTWTYYRQEGLSDTNSKTYYIYLNGSSSAARSGTMQAVAAPLYPPSQVIATDGDYLNRITVSWNSVSGATEYKIWRSQSSSGSYQYIGGSTQTSYDDTGVTAGVEYYYKVKSYSQSTGDSALSTSYDSGFMQNDIVSYLADHVPIIAQMNLSENPNSWLSRSDAVVLVDSMRNQEGMVGFGDLTLYGNPFRDVPIDSEYYPSLLRLAYYNSNEYGTNPITRLNSLFNPLRHVSRQEFVKIAIAAFNVPLKTFQLSPTFTDAGSMSDWARKYFETAVYYGIILGNDEGQLLAYEHISIQEALWILARIKNTFGKSYNFHTGSIVPPEALDKTRTFSKILGEEAEPRYDKAGVTPITISSVTVFPLPTDAESVVLEVVSVIDQANGADDNYKWETNNGYFKALSSSPNRKTVEFYPASSLPKDDYNILVTGWDDIGYSSQKSIVIPKETFSYPEDIKAVPEADVSFDLIDFIYDQEVTAAKVSTLDFGTLKVSKTNVELGIDHVLVVMHFENNSSKVYAGGLIGKQISFKVPDDPSSYGKDVDLEVIITTQNIKQNKTVTVRYLPQFFVTGTIYNTLEGPKATSVRLLGQEIHLDEFGDFSMEVDNTSEIHGALFEVIGGNCTTNIFSQYYINLLYVKPRVEVGIVGSGPTFFPVRPGDINSDGEVSLIDAVIALNFIDSVQQLDFNLRSDVNDDGQIGLAEIIYILNHVVDSVD